jgi:hypothetical protein
MHKQTSNASNLLTPFRVVLADLAERVGHVLKDEAELNSAISRLMRPKGSS